MYERALDLAARTPLLTLFVVAGIGWLVGRIRIRSFSLGVSAVFFAGLGAGALDKRLALPQIVDQLGLVVFVYTVGLAAGPAFARALRRRGLPATALTLGVLFVATALAALTHTVGGLSASEAGGLFAGSLTNVPALGGVVEHLRASGADQRTVTQAVVASALTYPIGVVAMLIVLALLKRWGPMRVDHAEEAAENTDLAPGGVPLVQATVRLDHDAKAPNELVAEEGWPVAFARVRHDGIDGVAATAPRLQPGDLVSVVGPPDAVDAVITALGEPVDVDLAGDRQHLDFRRMFVSNPQIAGRTLGDLDLPRRFGATATRIRRGDADLVATPETTLELGDRVRVVAPRERMGDIATFLGDSYRSLGEIDVRSIALGIAAGIALGLVPVPVPGLGDIRLGIAGGPIITGLLAGWRGRSRRIVWQIPYGANLTLRQFGVVLFFAGVGTRSGHDFAAQLAHSSSIPIVLSGLAVSVIVALLCVWFGRTVLGLPVGMLMGVMAGTQTQPAVLTYALEETHNDLPSVGYACVFPTAMIAKIVLAQVLVLLLGG